MLGRHAIPLSVPSLFFFFFFMQLHFFLLLVTLLHRLFCVLPSVASEKGKRTFKKKISVLFSFSSPLNFGEDNVELLFSVSFFFFNKKIVALLLS